MLKFYLMILYSNSYISSSKNLNMARRRVGRVLREVISICDKFSRCSMCKYNVILCIELLEVMFVKRFFGLF